ncbi:MAG: hypothetical protein JKY67_18790 [Pseudomonadales bacterium]|nr:hypothetical protein [Pseudomonadales bacterium]
MTFQGKEFCDLAYRIYQGISSSTDDSEAEYRTVINRAYYGVFLTAREAANNNFTTGPGSHKEVQEFYKNRGKEGYFIFNSLTDLFAERKAADYDINVKISPTKAKSVLTRSKKIIDSLV